MTYCEPPTDPTDYYRTCTQCKVKLRTNQYGEGRCWNCDETPRHVHYWHRLAEHRPTNPPLYTYVCGCGEWLHDIKYDPNKGESS